MEAWKENTVRVITANARMDMVFLERVVEVEVVVVVMVVVAMVIDLYFIHSGFLKLRTM